MKKSTFNRYGREDVLEVVLEDAAFDLQALIRDGLRNKGISQRELARRCELSEARVSQILNESGGSFEIMGAVKLLLALDLRLDLSTARAVSIEFPKDESNFLLRTDSGPTGRSSNMKSIARAIKSKQSWSERGYDNRNARPIRIAA